MHQKGFVTLIIIPILIVVLVGTIAGIAVYKEGKYNPTSTPIPTARPAFPRATVYPNTNRQTPFPSSVSQSKNQVFCKNYGTYDITQTDLFKTYLVKSGESFRQIAVITLNDETKAVEFISINQQFFDYEIDDPLPINTKVFIPNEKYMDPEKRVTSYIKASGNISFNPDMPLFGVNAPNSGTGPFTISDKITTDLTNIKEGDCVEVIYGSRGYNSQKMVLEVKTQ